MVELKIYLVTFNCARTIVDASVFGQHLLNAWKDPSSSGASLPDVIVLNLQEVAPIGYAFLGGNWVQPYFEGLRKAVDVAIQAHSVGEATNYVNVLVHNCGLTAMMILARKDIADEIQHIQVAEVGVGLSEMANKGAVGARIAWKTGNATLPLYTTFVSAHLAPFEADMLRRDQDYRNIASRITFSGKETTTWRKNQGPAEQEPLLTETGIETEFHQSTGMYTDDSYLFFAGDLNYRTAITIPGQGDYKLFPQPTKDPNDPRHFSHLLEKDQLSQQLHEGKTLHGLSEQPITFPPTYKYRDNTEKAVLLDDEISEWPWAKHRWPSWCDRILYSPTPAKLGNYTSLPKFATSDHRPVALSLAIPLRPVTNANFADKAPGPLDKSSSERRVTARRKEIAVGIAAYLGLTLEGRSLVLGAIFIILGATYLSKAIS